MNLEMVQILVGGKMVQKEGGDLEQQIPTFLAPETYLMEDRFSMDREWWAWFQDDSSTLHVLCMSFLI